MQLWYIENRHITNLINISTMKNYIFIPLFIWMAFFLPKQLVAQLPSQPDFEIMQNGHSNVDSVLSGSIFDLAITNFCPGADVLAIYFDNTLLDFLGGVNPTWYSLSSFGDAIQMNNGPNSCMHCDPVSINFQFRFKPGVTCNGAIAGIKIIGSRFCDTTTVFDGAKFDITALAKDYWTFQTYDRDPNLSYLPDYVREWRLAYSQNFTGGTPVNGIYPAPGIGAFNLKVDSVKIKLSSMDCPDSTLKITGYYPAYLLNPNTPNIAYNNIPSPDDSYTFTPASSYSVLYTQNFINEYNFFIKGEILTCDTCDYQVTYDSYSRLQNNCGANNSKDTLSGTATYEQTIFSYSGELIKYLSVPTFTHLAPGCSGEYTIRFINRGNTVLNNLTLTDTFPDNLLSADLPNIDTGSKFDFTTTGNLLIFTLKAGQSLNVNELIQIKIPFSVLSSAVPGTSFKNKVFAEFSSSFPQDTTYDHCGNEIIIPAASGVSNASAMNTVAYPDSKPAIFKCSINNGAINIGDQKEFIIYVINNGSDPLNTTLTDYLADNHLENIDSISYYSGTVPADYFTGCGFLLTTITDSLISGYSASFDGVDSWDITIPPDCDFGQYNMLAIQFKATQLPALSGSNCAHIEEDNLSACTTYPIIKFGRLKVDKFLNSTSGLSDWDTVQTMSANDTFEYKIVVTNTGSVSTIDTLEIHDTLPDCVEGITASINGVTVPIDDVYYYTTSLLPGDSVVVTIQAVYQGSLNNCINKATVRGYTNMSSNPLTPISNDAIIKPNEKDPCLKVDIVVDTSYIIKDEKIDLCCFDLYYENEYTASGIFRYIAFEENLYPPFLISTMGGFGQQTIIDPPKTYTAFRKFLSYYIPITSTPQPFLTICFEKTEMSGDSITVNFDWLGSDTSVVCTTPVNLICGGKITPHLQQLIKRELKSKGLLHTFLYPNPAKNTLNVFIDTDEKFAYFRIVNGNGNPLFNQKIDLSRDIVELDVSHYAPGFYILNITLPSGELKSLKFIKQ